MEAAAGDFLGQNRPPQCKYRKTVRGETRHQERQENVSIVREFTRNGGTMDSDDPQRESERLHCDLDQESNACYRTARSEWLRAKEASGYILRSILRVS